ncbi:hypothetical protein MASR2M17_13130 [Aminivibrio sp.]
MAGIVGLGAAIELASRMAGAQERVSRLRDMLIDGVMKAVPLCEAERRPLGRAPSQQREFQLHGIDIEGETLLLDLDRAGYTPDVGAPAPPVPLTLPCSAAIGLSHELAHGSSA